MQYRSSHVAKIFDISHETVRVWAEQFGDYLSPTARPGRNKQRLFTREDMAILALVAERKKQAVSFAEIHASLQNGQRGQAPAIEPEEAHRLVSSNVETQMALQLERMQHELVQAHEALTTARKELLQLQTVRDENIKLSVQLQSSEHHYQEVQQKNEQRITELMKRIEDLSREAGQQYSKGYVDALKEWGTLPKKDT